MQPACENVSPGLGRRILVVDDDGIQGKLVQIRLELAGFVVCTATGAADAIRQAGEVRPDAIVSDVLMDAVDGFSLCRMLRQNLALADVPVVLLSSHFDEVADGVLAREVGANALVERSPSMEACIDAVVRSLSRGVSSIVPEAAGDLLHSRLAHRLFRMHHEKTRAEARFQALYQHANDAISLLTPDGIVLDVNKKWEEIIGRPREQLIGLHVRDFSHARDAEANAGKYAAAAARNTHREGAVPIRRADGTTIQMEFSTATVDLDGTPRVLAIGRDVTSLVESQRRLEESERRYRRLVESVPEVFWSARTSDYRRTYVSPNVEERCGFTPEEMLADGGGPPFSRTHPDDAERVRSALAAAVRDGTPVDEELRWQHRDGRWLWLHFRAAAVRDETGNQSLEGVFSDVTARKALEQQLARSQKIEAIGQLSAGLAHDFNNVLAVILAGADYLASKLADEEDRTVAQEISEAAQRGADLTSRLLDFARSQAGRARPTNLDDLVAGLAPMLSRAVGAGVCISVVPYARLAQIRADRSELEQVLVNLAINARDAMPRGGSLTIATSNVDIALGDAFRDGKPSAGRYVVVSVTDTGTGMDEATRQRVFEPFFTTKAEKGTGLGLSTSYGIARRHGGHITVESTLGVGTTFTLYFPRLDEGRAVNSEFPHLDRPSRTVERRSDCAELTQ